MHLFSNRSQMMSKCGKNKKVAQVDRDSNGTLSCYIYIVNVLHHISFLRSKLKISVAACEREELQINLLGNSKYALTCKK